MSNIFLYDGYAVKTKEGNIVIISYCRVYDTIKWVYVVFKTLFIKETLWVSLYDDVMCAARGISWKVFLVGSPRRDLLRKLFGWRMQW